jgi:Tfp pilus assembly protein PilO
MKQRFVMLWSAGLLGLAIAVGLMHLGVTSSRHATLRALRYEIATLRKDITQAPSVEDAKLQLNTNTMLLKAALPADGDLTDLLGPLAQDLSELTESDRSLVTGATEKTRDFNRIPLLLTFRSSFSSVFDMLSRVNSYARIVRVRHLVITRSPESDGSIVDVSAKLVTFARVPEEGQ